MKPILLGPYVFLAAARRARKHNSGAAARIADAVEHLRRDPFDPVLRTHRLEGPLEGSWAAHAGDGLWIIFRFVDHRGTDSILLETVGEHVDTVGRRVSAC